MILAAANPSLDALYEVAELRRGEIHRPQSTVRVPGGKSLNAARAARALGASPEVVALLPRGGGQAISDGLAAAGVALEAVWTAGELRSCLSVLDRSSGRLTEFYEQGGEPGAGDWDRFATAVLERCERDRWLALCGSLPPGVEPGAYGKISAAAALRGAPVAVDAAGAALAGALEAGPNLVKVNLEEARGLFGSGLGAAELAPELRRALGGGERVGVVTSGGDGAVLAGPGEVLQARPPASVAAHFPVGSGDAFLAGLLFAREQGAQWEGALGLAVAAGTANAEVAGAGLLVPARVEELVPLVEVERI